MKYTRKQGGMVQTAMEANDAPCMEPASPLNNSASRPQRSYTMIGTHPLLSPQMRLSHLQHAEEDQYQSQRHD